MRILSNGVDSSHEVFKVSSIHSTYACSPTYSGFYRSQVSLPGNVTLAATWNEQRTGHGVPATGPIPWSVCLSFDSLALLWYKLDWQAIYGGFHRFSQRPIVTSVWSQASFVVSFTVTFIVQRSGSLSVREQDNHSFYCSFFFLRVRQCKWPTVLFSLTAGHINVVSPHYKYQMAAGIIVNSISNIVKKSRWLTMLRPLLH